jgi:hypothetical protein
MPPHAETAHICTGTGLAPATSAPGLGSPLPHLHRDWARPCNICTGTGLAIGPRAYHGGRCLDDLRACPAAEVDAIAAQMKVPHAKQLRRLCADAKPGLGPMRSPASARPLPDDNPSYESALVCLCRAVRRSAPPPALARADHAPTPAAVAYRVAAAPPPPAEIAASAPSPLVGDSVGDAGACARFLAAGGRTEDLLAAVGLAGFAAHFEQEGCARSRLRRQAPVSARPVASVPATPPVGRAQSRCRCGAGQGLRPLAVLFDRDAGLRLVGTHTCAHAHTRTHACPA